jgi:DNA-binding CsgD family transcriptional regulator
MTSLHILSGAMNGHSFELNTDTFLVGRGPENDIQIPDPSLSRRHVRVVRKGERYFVEDLDSTNGTWVNGMKAVPGEPMEIQEEEPIALGSVFISIAANGWRQDATQEGMGDTLELKRTKEWTLHGPDRRLANRAEMDVLYELSTALMESLRMDKVCERILQALFQSLKRVDAGAIFLSDRLEGKPEKVFALSRENRGKTEIAYSRTIVDRVIREAKPIVVTDTSCDGGRDLSDSIVMHGVKSLMCVPLTRKRATRGAIYVHSVHAICGFRREDLQFLTALSTPAVLAIENALLFEKTRQAKVKLRLREKELKTKTSNLVEANTVLKILLQKREQDKAELEENVIANMKRLVFPYLQKLRESGLDKKQSTYAEIVESNLKEIVTPFTRRLSSSSLRFTPTELRMADLIRQGKSSNEIAGLLDISVRTVESHRDNIRNKLMIKNKKENLRSHLLMLKE